MATNNTTPHTQQGVTYRLHPVCFLLLLLLSLPCLLSQDVPTSLSDPWNPGARCINISSLPDSALLGCKEYLTYDIIYVDDLQSTREEIWQRAQVLVLADDQCAYSATRQICALTFRPCLEVVEPITDMTIAIGGYPCRSLCTDLKDNCLSASQSTFGLSLESAERFLSCTAVNNSFYGVPTVDIFPPSNWTVYLDAAAIIGNYSASQNLSAGPFQCYDENRFFITGSIPVKCSADGLVVDASDEFCTLSCPQPLLTRDEYNAIEILISVLSWLSAFACFLTIFLLLIFSRSRLQAASLALIFCIGMEASAGCLGSLVGHEEVWCDDEGRANNFGDPACTIQGIINVYFELAGIMLWFVIILDIFLELIVKSSSGLSFKKRLSFEKNVILFGHTFPVVFSPISFCYVFFPMTLPLIPVIISLGAERLGYDGSNLWCTIHSGSEVKFVRTKDGIETEDSGKGNPWNMALMTGPSVILVLLGIVILFFIFVYVLLRTPGTHQRFTAVLRMLVDQWRLMLFVFVFALYYLVYLAFRIQYEVVKDAQYQSYSDYIVCSIRNFTSCISGQPSSCSATCEISQEISYQFWVIVVLGKWGKGMALLPIFGVSRAMITRVITRSKRALSGSNSTSDSQQKKKGSVQRITGRVVTTITAMTRSLDENDEVESMSTMLDELPDSESEETSSSSSGSQDEGPQF